MSHTSEERQSLERYPDLSHSSAKIYIMGWDSYGPIKVGASYVKWDESLIGVEGETWKIIDW